MTASHRYRRVVLAVAWRNLHNVFTNPALILPSLIFPLFFLLAFAGGLSAISRAPNFHFATGYTAFQFVFVLLQSAAFSGVFTGFAVAADFEHGFGRRLLLSAPNRTAIVAGYLLAGLTRALFSCAVVAAAALIGGMNVDGDGADVAGLVGLALVVNATAGLWALGIALRFRSIQAGPFMQIPVFLILFTAPVYVPLDLHLRRAHRGGARVCRRARSDRALRAVGGAWAAPGRERGLILSIGDRPGTVGRVASMNDDDLPRSSGGGPAAPPE